MSYWHKVDTVLGSRWELRTKERILAQVWQIRGDVYWKLGVFGTTQLAGSLSEARAAAETALAEQPAKDAAA